MPVPITIVPLGTSAAVPNATRSQSSLAVVLPSADTLLFDAGEGTQSQIQRFRDVKLGHISKIFITHMHGDHIFGLAPLLATLCNGAGGTIDGLVDLRITSTSGHPAVHIFGPSGIREYLRATLKLTYSHLEKWIKITELLFPNDPVCPTDPESCYEREVVGTEDIYPDPIDGFWHNITSTPEYTISAGPIRHSVPGIGYVLTESPTPGKIPQDYAPRLLAHKAYFQSVHNISNPLKLLSLLQKEYTEDEDISSSTSPFPSLAARSSKPKYSKAVISQHGIHLPDEILPRPKFRPGSKITILGDTHDPTPLTALALNSTVLIHEATNAYTPFTAADSAKEPYAALQARAISRGHSTPEMAALFARKINLGGSGTPEKGILILNHFSVRYKDDLADGPGGEAFKIMTAVRTCAENVWADGRDGAGFERDKFHDGNLWFLGFGGGKRNCAEPVKGVRGRVVCARDGVPIVVPLREIEGEEEEEQ